MRELLGAAAAGLCAALLGGCAWREPGPGPEVVTNRLGMQMVRVPAGEFLMGNDLPADRMAALFPGMEPQRLAELWDEAPVHRVRITRGFYMARHEVTVGQFRRFLEASGHVPQSIADGTGGYGFNPARQAAPTAEAFEGRDPRYSWAEPGFAQTDDHPVVNVSWNDAQAMAEWLSRIEGRRYRLPTEAEWEYACRAGTRTQFHHGDDPASLARSGNVFDADAAEHWPAWRRFALPHRDGHAFTAPVGRFEPNAFGLHDLHGNVWEWTADWHDERYYERSPVDDPPGPEDGSVKVRRGGSWHTWPLYARCSYRNWNSTGTRYVLVGIRLVMDVPR